MAAEPVATRLERVAGALRAHGVEFLVIGGMAEALFGSPRGTYDVDLCYRRTRENIERLARALEPLKPRLRGAPPDLPFRADASTLEAGCKFPFDTDAGALDLLGFVEPIGDYEQVLKNAEAYRLGAMTVRTIARARTCARKASGRPRPRASPRPARPGARPRCPDDPAPRLPL